MIYITKNLGRISSIQLQKVLDKFDLGKFLGLNILVKGATNRNILIESSKGKFVLKGNPLYFWQLPNEEYFINRLHAETSIKVPEPYLIDNDCEIFDWQYAIMPKLEGFNLNDEIKNDNISEHDRKQIAALQGHTLSLMQNLTNNIVGRLSIGTGEIKPFDNGYFNYLRTSIIDQLENCIAVSPSLSSSDVVWVNRFIDKYINVINDGFVPSIVMQDYKPANMLVQKQENKWTISGLIDLGDSYFGNGESDISRMYCNYLDNDRKDLAYEFINSYLSTRDNINYELFIHSFPFYILLDRVKIWSWAMQANSIWWNPSLNFHDWLIPYTVLDLKDLRIN